MTDAAEVVNNTLKRIPDETTHIHDGTTVMAAVIERANKMPRRIPDEAKRIHNKPKRRHNDL